jgi:diheme cytochrome c
VRSLAVVVGVFAALTACAGASSAVDASAPPERLYRSKCTGCHRAYAPDSLTRGRWAEVMQKMAPRAKLDEAARSKLLAWLQANAKDATAAVAP